MWCPSCESATVENYRNECPWCDTPLERLDPFQLAQSVTHASFTTSFLTTAIDLVGDDQ